MKMLKVHQNAPTSMLKSENFSGVIPPDLRIKRGGEGLGREGIGVWPTKNYPVAPPMVMNITDCAGLQYDWRLQLSRLNMTDFDLAKYDWRRRECGGGSDD
jgi:hypothetical protein